MTAPATFSSSWGLVRQPPLMAALQAMVWSSSSRAGGGVRPPGGEQPAPDLQQGVLDVPRVHVKGGLPHHQRPPAEVLGVEAELLQQRQVGQQGGPLLRPGDGG